MTKEQLIKKLEGVPDNMDIFIKKTDLEFEYSLLETVKVKKIKFSNGELKAYEKVIILTDE